MKIGIVGIGVVGSAVEYGMKTLGHDVLVHDIILETSLSDLINCDICYICVPTPIGENGTCDVSVVEEVIEELLYDLSYEGIIAIK